MKEQAIRELVIDALHKVTDALGNSDVALQLRDPNTNMAITDLGIDSLDAIEWCMEIEARSGVELDPAELTAHGSIDELVSLIVNRNRHAGIAGDAPQLVHVPRAAPLPLSFAQERIWTYSQTPQDCAAYALGMKDRILGPLDVAVLRDCLSYIVKRHEILRTTFTVMDGEPVHIIHSAEPIPLPVFQLASEADPEEEVVRIIKTEMSRVCDVTRGPLMRFSLVRIREDEHWLIRICHHLLWDAWSTRLLFGELALLYDARLDGTTPPLPESEPLQYVDYAAWQRKVLRRDGPTYQEVLAWWKERFQQQPRQPDLPFKRSAPFAGLDPADGVIIRPVNSHLVQRLSRLRDNEGATTYTVWLAALVALLAAETGQPNVVVGTYATNRRRAGVQNMIGCFANLATLCFRVDYATQFCDWLSEVRSWVTDAEAHCDIPHEELREDLQRLGVTLPEVRLIFGAPMGHEYADTHFAGLRLTRLDFAGAHVPLVAVMPWGFSINLYERNDLQECRATFDAAIYDPAGVRRFIGCLHELLDAISRHPDLPIAELLALSEAVQTPVDGDFEEQDHGGDDDKDAKRANAKRRPGLLQGQQQPFP